MYIKNVGSDILSSEPADIWLSLYVGIDDDPIKTVSFASSYQGAKIAPLKPGEVRTVNVEFHQCLTVAILGRIDCGEPVRIEIQGYDLGEDRVYIQNVKDRAVRLDIDNGNIVNTDYYGEDSIGLIDFLKKYAQLEIQGNSIQSIAGLQNSQDAWWEIILPTKSDVPSNILDATIGKSDQVCLLFQQDRDKDGLLDRDELIIGTNPLSADTDSDGVNDYNEIYVSFSDPRNLDTDFDGLTDGEECTAGVDSYVTDPTNPDSDLDGLKDYQEYTNRTDPTNPDTDADGLNDSQEVSLGTKPKTQDTDGDDLTDGQEVNTYLTDPKKSDTDGDGLFDGDEIEIGSSPLNADSDGDSFSDGQDVDPMSDVWINVNLIKMTTNSTELGPSIYDVTFIVRVKDLEGNLLNQSSYVCPDDKTSHEMNWVFSHNIPDDETKVIIEIWARDPSYPAPLNIGKDLDLTGGWNGSNDPLGMYFYFDLKTGTWYEKYGGDSESDGVTSGWDDGQGGNDVTLWYWLYV